MSVKTSRMETPPASVSRREADLWNLGVLPILVLGSLSGLLGVYWDISWHIDKGRDTFFTPPHNFIYLAILIVLVMSLYALVRDRRESPLHLTVGRFRLHPGVLIVSVGAALELFFTPADELWHRLFGMDVTLWAPMHLIGVMGLSLLGFGGLITSWIERRLSAHRVRQQLFGYSSLLFAATFLGWSMLFLAEYEFNIPAFPMLWHPLLLAGLPTFTLVLVANLRPVPWAATWTAVLFTLIRGLLAGWLMTSAGFDLAGETRPLIPMLIVSGLAADLLVRRRLPRWQLGFILGVISLLANLPLVEAAKINWHSGALLTGVPLGLALSMALAYLGAAVAAALEPNPVEADRPVEVGRGVQV
ncbi:MAG: hypothetical protein JSV66_16030 [Trueperaceae bacterium]|nr:MAG: hypothetical protein JSV66_16030 [Trueperaceae bacterium]